MQDKIDPIRGILELKMVLKAISKMNVAKHLLSGWAIDETGDSIPFGSVIFSDLAMLLEESEMLLRQSMERDSADIIPLKLAA